MSPLGRSLALPGLSGVLIDFCRLLWCWWAWFQWKAVAPHHTTAAWRLSLLSSQDQQFSFPFSNCGWVWAGKSPASPRCVGGGARHPPLLFRLTPVKKRQGRAQESQQPSHGSRILVRGDRGLSSSLAADSAAQRSVHCPNATNRILEPEGLMMDTHTSLPPLCEQPCLL